MRIFEILLSPASFVQQWVPLALPVLWAFPGAALAKPVAPIATSTQEVGTSGIGAAAAAIILCIPCIWGMNGTACAGEATGMTNDARFPLSCIAENHPRMRALVANAFQYVAPGRGTIDAASGYPVEGWNQDPQKGLFLRSFTQLTAIGVWVELLANIAAGEADNPYISRKQALDQLLLAVSSLRRDQHDPRVSGKGLLGNFLGFDRERRTGPLARDVARQDVIGAFGEKKGSAIWQALEKKGWIALENKGQNGVIQRGPQYGSEHFQGVLAPFSDDATRGRLMEILDRRVVMVAYGDNANLSTSVAKAIGALLRAPLRDQPAALKLRQEMERFLEDQRPGYQFLLDKKADMFRFGWNASTGKFFGWEDTDGHWKVGHSDYLVNEFRGPTMFVLLRYGLPLTAFARLGVKIKPYRLLDGHLVYTPAPWEGSAFQALGLSLSMGEFHDPSWKLILKNLVDIELDYAARHQLSGFLSEAYSGRSSQYTGSIGIPAITVSPNPRIIDAPSLYTLGIAYAIAPDRVERLLDANWGVVAKLLTDHGPWEGYNTSKREVIRFQTTVHVLSLILGTLNTASDNMAGYLDSRGLSESLDGLYKSGRKLDALSEDTRAIAWTPDKSSVRLVRDAGSLHFRGENVGQAGLTFVLPGQNGASLSGGLLTIRYQAQQRIDKAMIKLDKKDPALDDAGVIPSEIFLDTSQDETSRTASGAEQRTIQIPLPATPALAGIREVALFCGSSERRGPLDVSFTAFQFVPFPPDLEQRVEALLRRMTVEEKIGQLVLSASFWNLTGPAAKTEGLEESIRQARCGNVFNARSVGYIRKLQTIAVEKTRLGIPLLFGFDVIHGYKTIFPISLGEAASWDLEAIQRSARVAATEASAAGLNWTFAPMVDIARDPRWGRISEGAGEDPYLGCRVAEARVRGFQGDDLAAPATLLACAKHLAAYGAAQAGRDYNTVDISERTLREVYLPPFKAALDAGALSVMTSFSDLNGVPATANRFLLRDILRGEWGFRGFVVSDYTAINELVAHGTAENERDAARQAFSAGVDMDMQGGAFDRYLRALLSEGRINQPQIDDAVRRILRLKFMLGLFDDPYRYCDRDREKRLLGAPAHRQAAYDMACKSMVLLKNGKQTLPLKPGTHIAVIGPLAQSRQDLLGSWSADGDAGTVEPVLAAIAKANRDGRVSFARGCDVDSHDRSGFAQAVNLAKQADVVVMVLGESQDMSGEAASRTRIGLPGVQSELVEAIAAAGKPLVLVLMNGRPLALEKESTLADAILEAWYPGSEGARAVADMLFGKRVPSGKLPVTFPRCLGQTPIYYGMKRTGRPMDPAKPGEEYVSRYLDCANDPLYPFGFGLSYTTFAYCDLRLVPERLCPGEQLTVTVTIRNSGRYDGAEVVQLYIQDLVGSVTRPVRELKGFRRVELRAGESCPVTFSVGQDDLRFVRRDMTWGTEPGTFRVLVGPNSRDLLSAPFDFIAAKGQ